MTLFIISESEKASYVDQIYSYLGDDPFLKQFLPIDPATKDFFNLVNDGVLLCKLINIVVPGIIDERAVSTKRVLNPWERNGNHTLCLNSAKAIGCMVVNIGTQHLVEGTPRLWLGLISLIIKIIAHTKENVVKKQALTYDEMEAEREEVNNGKKSESITRQELANLDKDADSRKSAMKALKSYVKGLDSKAIPPFLAQVSKTKETRSLSGEYTISLYEVHARVHGGA